jgi:nucleoside-diphosphate-sugar epimerase
MKVAITGASGFIGTAIAKGIRSSGSQTVTLGRKKCNSADTLFFDLREKLDPRILDTVDVLIHSAYDFAPRKQQDIKAVNIQGSMGLFDTAEKCGVKKILFISSMAAHAGAISEYGRSKYCLENRVSQIDGGMSIRPGTVWSEQPAGIVGKMARISRMPFCFYPEVKNSKIFLLYLGDLVECILNLTSGKTVVPHSKVVSCAHPEPVEVRDLLLGLAPSGRRIMVPVPAKPCIALLEFLERLPVALPFRSDSLKSLLCPIQCPENLIQMKYRQFIQTS